MIEMMDGGMSRMMGGIIALGLLVLVLMVLGIAALAKYLFAARRR